jgi:hypothetical protein
MKTKETRPGVKPKAGPKDPLAADHPKHNGRNELLTEQLREIGDDEVGGGGR